MVMLAHFEYEVLTGDRRGSARRSLRLDVGPSEGPLAGAPVTIHDLSLTGLLIETSAGLDAGEKFQVSLPEAGSVDTTVVWSSGEYYGCHFNQPISPAALSAALLQSVPDAADAAPPAALTGIAAELHRINTQVEQIAADLEAAVQRLTKTRREQRDRD